MHLHSRSTAEKSSGRMSRSRYCWLLHNHSLSNRTTHWGSPARIRRPADSFRRMLGVCIGCFHSVEAGPRYQCYPLLFRSGPIETSRTHMPYSPRPDDDALPRSSGDTPAASRRVVEYTRAVQRIKDILLSGVGIETVLQAVCREVAVAVPGADLVGITLIDAATKLPGTAASTDSRVNDVDADQYHAAEGPCLEAARTGHMVRARAVDAGERWPRFAARVADIGIGSYLAAPFTLDNRRLGALNIYGYSTHGFSDIDEALVALFVTAIEAVVQISRRAHSAEQEVDGLHTAMKTRADIEQAKGIIMAMRGLGADEAFAVLSEQSQNRNIKVSDIASAMIDSIVRFPSEGTVHDNSRRSSSRSDE